MVAMIRGKRMKANADLPEVIVTLGTRRLGAMIVQGHRKQHQDANDRY
jgi:hypothetical protein